MADDDKTMIVGLWSVRFRNWTWEYNFSADGGVTWRDPLNGLNGSGRWAKQGNYVPSHLVWLNDEGKFQLSTEAF